MPQSSPMNWIFILILIFSSVKLIQSIINWNSKFNMNLEKNFSKVFSKKWKF